MGRSSVLRLLGMLAALSTAPPRAAAADDGPWLRVNLVGYLPDDPKVAVLSSGRPLEGAFRVGAIEAPIGPDQGAWGPFAHNYRLDFSALRAPGRYRVSAAGVESAEFAVGPDAYAAVAPALIEFLKLQRCGPANPVTGKDCHMHDAIDTIDGTRVDLVGGWHDAADRLKHMITTSYTAAALALAEGEAAKAEARHGAKLVAKLNPAPGRLYVQIGDDRDHLPPATLWHDDRSDYGHGPGGPRSAWRATGAPEGPKYKNESSGMASLAGRCAAALALNGDLTAARRFYDLAVAHPGNAMSVPVRAPHYYGESSYHDDLEWGAVELFLATREPRFLAEAAAHADRAGDNPWMGRDRHGHYEFFPYVNLAHWRLHPHVDTAARARIAGYYRDGLDRVRARAETNAYRLGTPVVWCSTNDVIALATQARLYQSMTGDTRFRTLATEARDWIFGRNPWGSTFVVGVPAAGRAPRDPHHMFSRLAHHAPVGGLVDGPVTRAINEGLKFDDFGADALARFQSDVAVYHDVYADFSTNEPILDGTASLLLLLSVWGQGAGPH